MNLLHRHVGDLGIEVLDAPERTTISKSLYDEVADRGHFDGCPDMHVEAGEGWFVIHAINGTYRYRLLEEIDFGRAYKAELVAVEDIQGDAHEEGHGDNRG